MCSNDDPMLTLTYFMTRSNLVFFAFIRGKLLQSDLRIIPTPWEITLSRLLSIVSVLKGMYIHLKYKLA